MSSTDNLEIINTNNWEIIDNSNLIIVDKNIAKTIIKLNKLGYITKACCEGHFKCEYFFERNYCDNEYLEQIENDSHSIITQKNEKYFNYLSDRKIMTIYIAFEKNYHFDNLPEGFIQDSNLNLIEHVINFLDEYDNHRSPNSIIEEINKYNKILEEWAYNLPENKERK